MLLRTDDRGVLAIGQPAHAWVSGQLARNWGNPRFGAVEPREEVCLAAEQHDIGMAGWDLEPTLNRDTGLPHSFIEMPLETHLELWSAGPRRLLRQSRYAALLTSMHGVRLYELRDLNTLPPAQAAAIREFMHQQRVFQQDLVATLAADSPTTSEATPEVIARNSQLVWTWDFLSLALLLDWTPCTAEEVPTAGEQPLDIHLAADRTSGHVTVDPWPFTKAPLTIRCEGQRLTGRYQAPEQLHDALASAPWETLELELRPAAA
ncbi:MAG TPA: DUF3891 family protein [Solirubrobacteraceae bacterium]|nr:DUF3891 family protein [Solirubrobacteraceae bacterium]